MVCRLFEKGKHRITIRDRNTGIATTRRYFGSKQLNKIIANQKDGQDLFIQPYSQTGLIKAVVFDLDCKENPSHAYDEAVRAKKYFERNGQNCVITQSGSKGNHLWVEVEPILFASAELRPLPDGFGKKWFKEFVNELLNGLRKPLETLDPINSSAGLGSNIRIIGSKHGKTGNKCEIVYGEFKGIQPPTKLTSSCLKLSYRNVINDEEAQLKKQVAKKNSVEIKFGTSFDPIRDIDLRDVFRQLADDFKLYESGYGYCKCLYHPDAKPSMLVTENWFSCSSCGEKGNVFKLFRDGFVKWDYDGNWKVGR